MTTRNLSKNPGAAWHEQQYNIANQEHKKYGIENDIRNMDMALGKSSAHLRSYLKSKEEGIPNPKKKNKIRKSNAKGSLLIILGLGGLLYWITKTKVAPIGSVILHKRRD